MIGRRNTGTRIERCQEFHTAQNSARPGLIVTRLDIFWLRCHDLKGTSSSLATPPQNRQLAWGPKSQNGKDAVRAFRCGLRLGGRPHSGWVVDRHRRRRRRRQPVIAVIDTQDLAHAATTLVLALPLSSHHPKVVLGPRRPCPRNHPVTIPPSSPPPACRHRPIAWACAPFLWAGIKAD